MALLTLLSGWPLLSPWLSPAAAWFIFFNAVVGAIAVMSTSSGAGATSSPRRRLCRSGSSSVVLDRLRSFFVFPVGQLPIDESSAASGSYCCSQSEADAASATQVCAPERNPQALAARTGESETAAIGAAQPTSAPVAMAIATAEDDHAPSAPPPEEEEEEEEDKAEKEKDHDESISLDEAYALAQRHRASPSAVAASATTTTAPAPAALPTEHKKHAKVVADWDWGKRVSKAGEAVEGKAELNARAELFIRQFREDLRLQRLNSILKHTHALGSPTAAR